MKTTQRRAVTAAAVIALGLTVSACQTQSKAASGNPAEVSIMVGGLDKVIYLPAELTERLGYFKDQGLTVKLQSQPSGANAETALVAGQVDGVVGFYDHTIDLQTKGKCIRSVVQFANVPGEVEIVGKDAGITGAKDFAGKKLGITSPGSSTDFLTQYLAGKAGAATDEYTTVAAGAGATFIAALQNGGIDAGMTTDPTAQQIKEKGLGDVLLDMRTEEGTRAALGGLYPASSLYMDCDYVEKNPQTVQKLANALVKTLAFINTHSGQEIAQQMPGEYASGSGGAASYAAAIDASKGMFTATGVMDPDGAQNVLTVLSQFNPNVKGKAGTVDLGKTYTTEFASKATG
ncbi:ABC transporter substrate-binding protein [Kineosporia mesophila]|uniref:ABC transporter substrate-binding protein n=2 Tax=Kineosporia mesophila TaxID=566012 RepID=A0ABP6ZN88_9ACTN